MPSPRTNEIGAISQNILDSGSDVDCITDHDHEGLQAVCMNLSVIQTAYFSQRQHEGEIPYKIDHEYDKAN